MRLLLSIVLLGCAFQSTASDAIKRIAFGSCAMQFKTQPVWDLIAQQKPDLFLFVGDAIYADFDGKAAYTPSEENLKRDWGLLKMSRIIKSSVNRCQ